MLRTNKAEKQVAGKSVMIVENKLLECEKWPEPEIDRRVFSEKSIYKNVREDAITQSTFIRCIIWRLRILA